MQNAVRGGSFMQQAKRMSYLLPACNQHPDTASCTRPDTSCMAASPTQTAALCRPFDMGWHWPSVSWLGLRCAQHHTHGCGVGSTQGDWPTSLLTFCCKSEDECSPKTCQAWDIWSRVYLSACMSSLSPTSAAGLVRVGQQESFEAQAGQSILRGS